MSCCDKKRRQWWFANNEQTTASNTLREIVGFYGSLYMSFEGIMLGNNGLDQNIDPVVTVIPDVGVTVGTPLANKDRLTIEIPLTLVTTGTYMFIVTGTDLSGEETTRRSILVVESLTGT